MEYENTIVNQVFASSKNNGILFGTVVFPGVKDYLYEFMSSIYSQDYKDFDVLIINDGVDRKNIKKLMNDFNKLNITCVDIRKRFYPSELRVMILSYAKKNYYKLLILGDSDDTFSNSRISSIVESYKNSNATFFYNSLISGNGVPVFESIPSLLRDYREVGEYNFVGLSMMAVRVEQLSQSFICSLNEYKGGVFDWYLVSRLLLDDKYGVYVDKASTIYRIHNGNFVGIPCQNEDSVKKEIEIKRYQYSLLRKYSDYYSELSENYTNNRYEVYNTNKRYNYWWGLTRSKNSL